MKIQDLLAKVPFSERLSHKGPWWELLPEEDQRELRETAAGLFVIPVEKSTVA